MIHHLVDMIYVFQLLAQSSAPLDSQESVWGEVMRKIHNPRTQSLFIPPLISYKNQAVSIALDGLLAALEWCPSTGGFIERLVLKVGNGSSSRASPSSSSSSSSSSFSSSSSAILTAPSTFLFSVLNVLVTPDFYVAMPILQSGLLLLMEIVTLPTNFGRSVCHHLNSTNFSLILQLLRSLAPDLTSGLVAALAAMPHTKNLEYQVSKKPASPAEEEESSSSSNLKGVFHLSLVDYEIDSFVNVAPLDSDVSPSAPGDLTELGILRLEMDEKTKQLVAIGIDSSNPAKEYKMEVSIIKEVEEGEGEEDVDEGDDHDHEDDEEEKDKFASKKKQAKAKKGDSSSSSGKTQKGKKQDKHEEEEEQQEEEEDESPTVLTFRIPRPNGKVLLCKGTMLPGRLVGTFKETNVKATPEEEAYGFSGSFFAWLDVRPYSAELWKVEKQAIEAYKRNVVDKKKTLKVSDQDATRENFRMILSFLQMQWVTSHWTRASASEVQSVESELSNMTELGAGEEIEPHMKDLEAALFKGPNESPKLFKKRAILAAHLRMIIAQIQHQLMEALEDELKDDIPTLKAFVSNPSPSPTTTSTVTYIVRKYRRAVATCPLIDPPEIIIPEALIGMYSEMSDPKAKKERELARLQMEEEERERLRTASKASSSSSSSSKKGSSTTSSKMVSDQDETEDDEEEESGEEDQDESAGISSTTKLIIIASAISAVAALGAYAIGRWFSRQGKTTAAGAASRK